MAKGVSFEQFANADQLACDIANKFTDWQSRRSGWDSIRKEVRDYIFATSTRTTTTGNLGWKNSVHIPKVCQIRDNLYSNLMAAVYPHDKVITWEGDDETSQTKQKRRTITAYMTNKLQGSGFAIELGKVLLDLIDTGNCFATVEYVNEQVKDGTTGETHQNYVGPVMRRLSPDDVVFDPTTIRFVDTPKIIRSLKTLADLRIEIENQPEKGYLEEVFKKIIDLRQRASASGKGDVLKNDQFIVDGFSSWLDYFQGDTVECLDFYGDIYDTETDTLYKNYVITVVDRAYIIRKIPQATWLGKSPIFHCGWRVRPDNLYAMGPLDNIVGMQYRIDHLENAKADGIDLIIHPVLKITGAVEHFNYGPNAKIYCSEEGNVDFMHPDATILNLDTQIAIYEQKMEEMAGMPKQAMGYRTPGEKTAYEVQMLDQGANKPFVNKASYFEEVFLQNVLNAMLEAGRRNIGVSETIRVEDEDFNFQEFLKITKEDISARGKIKPVGARRYARNANLLQNLTAFSASPLGQDPAVITHFSGKKIAKIVEDFLGFEQYNIVEDNIRVMESIETQQIQSDGQQILMEKGAVPNQVPGAPPQAQGSAAAVPGMPA